MSESLAHYIFLPFLRRGMAQYIETEDKPNDPNHNKPGQRTGITVSIHVDQPNEEITQFVQFYGPGDVIGLDHRMIVRTDPTHRTVVGDYEPNKLPIAVLSHGDLPWCVVPAIAPTGHRDRLRPFICLIALKAPDGEDNVGEYEELDPASDRPLPAIEVKPQNGKLPLPDLDQSWAWAHVQVTTEKQELTPDEFADILENSPHLVTSNLMCPRKLEENVLYHIFIVSTLESCRLTGLGEEIPEETCLLDPAWDANSSDPVRLPYFFKWEFRTGLRGDFEYLVRLLEPRIIDKRVGIRHINCRYPRYDFENIVSVDELTEEDELKHSLGLEGALRSLRTESTKWPTNTEDEFQSELKDLLNLPNSYPNEGVPGHHDNPLIVPPLYGAWQASRKEVTTDVPNSNDPEDRDWFNELNLDPRHRMTSAFGTLVIQDQQEHLMASAWEQVGTVLEANQRLRQGQFAMEVGEKLHAGSFQQLSTDNLIALTSKLHSRVLIDTEEGGKPASVTIQHLINNKSRIPISVLTPAFRRIQRPRGPLASSQKQDEDPNRKSLLERLNEDEIAPAGEPPEPDGTVSLGGISESLRPPRARIIEIFGLKFRWILLFIISVLALGLFCLMWAYRFLIGFSPLQVILPYIVIAIVLLTVILRYLLPLYVHTVMSHQVNAEHINAEKLRGISIEADSSLETPSFVLPEGEPDPLAGLDPEKFLQYAVQAHEKFLDRGLETIIPPEPLDLSKIQSALVNALNPRATVLARTKLQFRFSDMVDEDLTPIRIGPVFSQPMYEPLRDLSQELLLPGLEFVPQNTIGLLETNRKFIESYMVGTNAEMARELLWREYPSPLDATYFMQFWDVSEYIPTQEMEDEIRQELEELDDYEELTPQEIEVEFDKLLKSKLRDINEIHRWRKWDSGQHKWVPAKLGQNPLPSDDRTPTAGDDEVRKLVLLIRGDLLKKYPTTLIYAVEGKWVKAQEGETYICRTDDGTPWRREPNFSFEEDKTKTPIFRGTLPPEITFLGFDLVEEDARGHTEMVTPNPEDSENHPGWYFVIEERVGEPRFGIDVPLEDQAGEIDTWDDLNWNHIVCSDLGYIIETSADCDNLDPPWDSNSAERANILLQKPIRVAIHADDMMPKEE